MLPVYFLAFFSEIIAELELKPNIARWILNLSSVLCGQGPLIVRPQVQKPSHLSAQPVKAPPVKPGTQVLWYVSNPYVVMYDLTCVFFIRRVLLSSSAPFGPLQGLPRPSPLLVGILVSWLQYFKSMVKFLALLANCLTVFFISCLKTVHCFLVLDMTWDVIPLSWCPYREKVPPHF